MIQLKNTLLLNSFHEQTFKFLRCLNIFSVCAIKALIKFFFLYFCARLIFPLQDDSFHLFQQFFNSFFHLLPLQSYVFSSDILILSLTASVLYFMLFCCMFLSLLLAVFICTLLPHIFLFFYAFNDVLLFLFCCL